MKKFNKKKFLSLILAVTMVVTSKHCIDLFFKKHPEHYYNITKSDCTYYLQDDDNYESLDKLPLFDTMVPQGIALSNDYMFVSMYDALKLKKSIICVLDKECNLVNKVALDCYSHVGGIAYDDVNNLLWVSGTNGSVRTYKIEDILEKEVVEAIYTNDEIGDDLVNFRGQNAVSYLTIDDGKLFVGNFTMIRNGTLKVYGINCKDNIDLEYLDSLDVPSKVQGVTFYDNGDNKYILFARSYGTENDSVIQVFKYGKGLDCSKDNYFTIMMDPMLEQVQLDTEGRLYSIFESNAVIYCDGNKDEDYKVFDFNSLVKK